MGSECRITHAQARSGMQESLLLTHRRKSLVREQVLSQSMAIVMLISSGALLFKAVRKFKFWDTWYLDHGRMDEDAQFATRFLAWYGVVIYSMQAFCRGMAACQLRRWIVWNGCVASVVSVLFLFVLGVAALYEEE